MIKLTYTHTDKTQYTTTVRDLYGAWRHVVSGDHFTATVGKPIAGILGRSGSEALQAIAAAGGKEIESVTYRGKTVQWTRFLKLHVAI